MRSFAALQSAVSLAEARLTSGTSGWQFQELAGYITELSAHGASATLTFAMRLVWEAQDLGEPVAWITSRQRFFFPPDALANGVDLGALALVLAQSLDELARAADLLVRSGAFGLVVIDLGDTRLTERQLTRLLGLARTHDTAIVCLTVKAEASPSLGSLVSLRASVRREREQAHRFRCELAALKDKRRSPGWRHTEICHAPPGLR